MAVAQRVRQPFHQQDAGALGPSGAVGRRGERLAASVRGQRALAAELHEHAGRRHDRHSAREGHGALAGPQRPYRPVQRHQGRRAGGVHRHRGTLQSEGVGDAAGGHADRAAGQPVAVDALGALPELGPVLLEHRSEEDARPAAAQRVRVDAGALHGLPGGLQQHPLLRFHRQGLAGRDAEEGGVERVGVVEEPSVPYVTGAAPLQVGVVQVLQVPATVVREVADHVLPVDEQVPQLLGGRHPAGEAARHGHDRDRLVGGAGGVRRGPSGRCVVGPGEQAVQVGGGRGRRRVVEEGAGGEGRAGRRLQPVAQVDHGDGVEAERLERALPVDVMGPVVPEDDGDLLPYEVGRRFGRHRTGRGRRRGGAAGPPLRVRLGACLGTGLRAGVRILRGLGRRGRGQPVAPALEGVRRQAGRLRSAAEDGGPVDVDAAGPRLAGRQQEAVPAALAAAQGAHHQGVVVRAGRFEGLLHRRYEDRVGAHLDEAGEPVGQRGTDAGLEPDGLAQVPVPVLAVQPGLGEPCAGHGRVERHRAGHGVDPGEGAQHLVAGGLDLGTVRGVVDGDLAGADAGVRAVGQQVVEGLRIAGDHGRRGAVDRGDGQPPVVRGDQLAGRTGVHRDGRHAAAVGQDLADRPAAERHHPGSVLRRQGARHDGRGDLPLGVPEHRGGAHAHGPPHLGEGDHDGPQRRLDDVDAVEEPGAGGVPHHFGQRPVGVRGQGGLALRHARGEDGRRLQQCGGHARPLRPLAREDEHHAGVAAVGRGRRRRGGARGARHAADDVRGTGAGRQRPQTCPQGGVVLADDDGPVFEPGPPGGQRAGDGGRVGPRVQLQVGVQPRGLLAERGLVPRGHRPRQRAGGRYGVGVDGDGLGGDGGIGLGGDDGGTGIGGHGGGSTGGGRHGIGIGGGAGRGVGDDHVAVRTAQSERGDTRDEPAVLARPGPVVALHGEVQLGERDARVGPLVVEGGHHLAVADAGDDLQQSGDARRRLQVPDVRLDRADQDGGLPGPPGAERPAHGRGFQRVADLGAGAVQLHVLDVGGPDAGRPARVEEDRLLGAGVGNGQAVAAAVVVDGAALDDGQDPVAVGEGLPQGLEQDEAAALAARVPVGPRVEGIAAAVGREGVEALEAVAGEVGEDEVDPAGQHGVALSAQQALHAEVDGDEGRGLPGVDHRAGPSQAEVVGDPVGEEAALASGQAVPGHGVGAPAVQQGGVVVVDGAEEDPDPGAPQGVRGGSAVLHRLPAQLERQALLGVHGGRFRGRDLEEIGVEAVHRVEVSARQIGVSGAFRTPRFREFTDPGSTVLEKFPELARSGGSGDAAGVTHDRDLRAGFLVVTSGYIGSTHR